MQFRFRDWAQNKSVAITAAPAVEVRSYSISTNSRSKGKVLCQHIDGAAALSVFAIVVHQVADVISSVSIFQEKRYGTKILK